MICDNDIFPTPSEICTEIQMHRKALSYNGAFIIVEGDYDSRLFSKFFENNCTLPIIACGKENVIEVFSLLNNTEKGYIGIVDADCDLIECLENPFNNLFLTDTHDIETMMLTTNALDAVLSEYAERKKLKDFQNKMNLPLIQVILKNAEYLGYLRYYSEKYKKNWRFKELPYSQFISKDTLELDKERLHDELKRLNPLKNINDLLLSRLSAIIDRTLPDPDNILNNPKYNPWHLCQGHDLTSILFIGLTRIFGNEKTRFLHHNGDLESELRIAYNEGLFKKTLLFNQIKDWEANNHPFIIIKRELIEA